jgi:hypothetical protein
VAQFVTWVVRIGCAVGATWAAGGGAKSCSLDVGNGGTSTPADLNSAAFCASSVAFAAGGALENCRTIRCASGSSFVKSVVP